MCAQLYVQDETAKRCILGSNCKWDLYVTQKTDSGQFTKEIAKTIFVLSCSAKQNRFGMIHRMQHHPIGNAVHFSIISKILKDYNYYQISNTNIFGIFIPEGLGSVQERAVKLLVEVGESQQRRIV